MIIRKKKFIIEEVGYFIGKFPLFSWSKRIMELDKDNNPIEKPTLKNNGTNE